MHSLANNNPIENYHKVEYIPNEQLTQRKLINNMLAWMVSRWMVSPVTAEDTIQYGASSEKQDKFNHHSRLVVDKLQRRKLTQSN